MEKNKNLKFKNKLSAFLLLIATMLLVATAFAFFSDIVSGNKTIKPVIPITEYNPSNSLELILEDLEPNSEKEYEFSITNFKNDETSQIDIISQIDMEYEITIETFENLPLKYKLYKNGEDENLLDENLVSKKSILVKDIKQTDNYKLLIIWGNTEEDYDYKYAEEIEYINIKVNSEQFINY